MSLAGDLGRVPDMSDLFAAIQALTQKVDASLVSQEELKGKVGEVNDKVTRLELDTSQKFNAIEQACSVAKHKFENLEKVCNEVMNKVGVLETKVSEVERRSAESSEYKRRDKKNKTVTEQTGGTGLGAGRSSGSGVWDRDLTGDTVMGGAGNLRTGGSEGGSFPARAGSPPAKVGRGSAGVRSGSVGGGGGVKSESVTRSDRLWLKGFGRKMSREDLLKIANDFVKQVNEDSGTLERFQPKAYGWNLEMSASLVFSGGAAEAERFFQRAREVRYVWDDDVAGSRLLRVTKDASFDQRLRGQVFHNLEEELKAVLRDKNLMSDKVWVGNTGPRGILFLGNGARFFELGKVNIAKQGEGVFGLLQGLRTGGGGCPEAGGQGDEGCEHGGPEEVMGGWRGL